MSIYRAYLTYLIISDHLPVYCVKKKSRKKHDYVYRSVRDLSNYNADVFSRLIRNLDWEAFYELNWVDEMWRFLYDKMYEILGIMCPLKRFRQRAKATPWLTADIYRAMRRRDSYISRFRATGNQYYLHLARRSQNAVNQMVSRAKAIFIQSKLSENTNNPRKFWRVINNIINSSKELPMEMHFLNKETGSYVEHGKEADFLNDYLLNIVRNLNIVPTDDLYLNVYDIKDRFCFLDDIVLFSTPG